MYDMEGVDRRVYRGFRRRSGDERDGSAPVRSIPVLGTWLAENVAYPIGSNPFTNIFAFFWVTGCVLLTAFLIYRLNLGWCLKKADLDDGQKKKIALSLAVFTAPYLFYLPTIWFV